MKPLRRSAAATIALCAAAAARADCPLPATALQGRAVQVAWQVEGPAIAVGRHFVLQLQLCPQGARLVRVDAHMPEHRHGMNYRPSLQPLGAGRWRAEGLMLHMAGRWELRFDVLNDGATERLQAAVELP